MVTCLVLVVLNRLQECHPLFHNISIFYRYHLVKVYCVSLVLGALFIVAIVKSNFSWCKWLQMVAITQLVVKNFQFVLYLGIVWTRSGICFMLFGYLIHKISLNRWLESICHIWLRNTKTWANLLKDSFLFMIF